MSSSPDDTMIEAALHDFNGELYSAFPLRNFREFHEGETLKEEIQQKMEDALENFFSKLGNRDKEEVLSLLRKLRERMNKEVIAVWRATNERHKVECVAYLQGRSELLCEEFQVGLQHQLLLNPQMEMDSLKNAVEQGKVFPLNYFDGICKRENCQMIKEQRRVKMVKNLDAIGEEVMDKHKLSLEKKSVDERKIRADEVKTILLEKERQLKTYVDTHQERVSRLYLKTEVEDIKEYLSNGKGSSLRESQKEIHSKLMGTLERGIKFLTEGDVQSPQDLIQWMERFHLKFRLDCSDIDERGSEPSESQRVQEDGNEFDSAEQERSWITMQEMLKEEPDFWSQEEPETESTHEEGGSGNVDLTGNNEGKERDEIPIVEETNSEADVVVVTGPAAAAKKRARYSKKKKTMEKPDSSSHRQTTKGSDNKTSILAEAKPTRRSSRFKKNSTDPDLAKDAPGDGV